MAWDMFFFSPMTYIHIKIDRAWPLGRVTSHQNRSRTAFVTCMHIKIDRAWGHLPSNKIEESFVTCMHIKIDGAWPLGRVTSQQNRSRRICCTIFSSKKQGGFFTYERCGRGGPGLVIGSHDNSAFQTSPPRISRTQWYYLSF